MFYRQAIALTALLK